VKRVEKGGSGAAVEKAKFLKYISVAAQAATYEIPRLVDCSELENSGWTVQ
jgi:hypothetical protein